LVPLYVFGNFQHHRLSIISSMLSKKIAPFNPHMCEERIILVLKTTDIESSAPC
jgi:hypothetical protein